MQFLILGNIPENVNLIYTKHTTDIYMYYIYTRMYLHLFMNDYLHLFEAIGINEANKSADVKKNIKSSKNATKLSPRYNAL